MAKFKIVFPLCMFFTFLYGKVEAAEIRKYECAIEFELGKYEIEGEHEKELDKCLHQIGENEFIHFAQIISSANLVGNDKINEKLSKDRLDATFTYLKDHLKGAEVKLISAGASEYLDKKVHVLLLVEKKNNSVENSIENKESLLSKDLSVSAGYSLLNISGDIYSGFNISSKLLFPISENWSLGFGGKLFMLSTTSEATTDSGETEKSTFNAFYGGVDATYKLSFSFLDFKINPYLYYGFYNYWNRDTTFAGVTTTGEAPVTTNLMLGTELSVLFNLGESWYLGPAISYSHGYLQTGRYADSKGNVYKSKRGGYDLFNMNLTIGIYL